MAKNLKLNTLNVRGLGQDLKRKTLASWLSDNHRGVLYLQETHSTDRLLHTWENDFNCKIFASHGSTSKAGVAILIPNELPHKINEMITDSEGRYVIVDLTVYEEQ